MALLIPEAEAPSISDDLLVRICGDAGPKEVRPEAPERIDLAEILAGADEGERDYKAYRLTSKMRRLDIPRAIAEHLITVYAAACRPPWPASEALAKVDGAYSRYAPERSKAHSFTFRSAEQIKQLPPPEWLIDGIIPEAGTVALSAWPGAGKSITTLDMALCIGAGLPWAGHPTQQGAAVYVSAEGVAGLGERVRTWEIARGVPAQNIHILTTPVPLLQKDAVEAFADALSELPAPPAIIFDTLARCFAGGDENSAKDVGLAIAAADRLRELTGATILLIHHVTKAEKSLRGSSALLGALDTHIDASRNGDTLILECHKQKEAEEFKPIYLRLRKVEGTASVVFEPTDVVPASGPNRGYSATLLTLLESYPDGASASEWQTAAEMAGIPRTSFYRAKEQLEQTGRVVQIGQGRGSRFKANGADGPEVVVPCAEKPDLTELLRRHDA